MHEHEHEREPNNARVFKNTVLQALSEASIERLSLRPVEFELEHQIEYPGTAIQRLYFVEVGMASMTSTFSDGSQVEVGTFGCESVIGVSALMGTVRSLNRVYTQIAGRGYSSPLAAASKEFARGERFQTLSLRCVQAQLLQAMQSAGCNAKHNLEQRLARWLLICMDRAKSTTFGLSQQFLSEMLGSTRSTVSVTAGLLKEEGLIAYQRGVIQLMDVPGLERKSCECYAAVKDHLKNQAEFDSTPVH